MEEKIIQLFKNLKTLQPNEHYVQRSKHIILSSPQNQNSYRTIWSKVFESLKVSSSLALASLLLFVLVSGIAYNKITSSRLLLTSFNQSKLVAEADTLNLDIHLKEAKYFDDTNKEIESALKKISEQKK